MTGPAVAALLLALPACSGPAPATPPPVAPAPAASGGHQHHHAAGPAPSGAPGGTVVVHAADELRPTLAKLIPMFEEGFPGIKVAIEYGASAEHVQHIREGAPIDVFVSTDATSTSLVTAGLSRGEPVVVARNPIVIAVPGAAPQSRIATVLDLPKARVAMCAETVACGRSGRAALTAASVAVRPVAVEPDAAAALAQVRTGAADAALVHRTDVTAAGDDLRAVDIEAANRIADEYTAIRPTTGVNTVGADAFVTFLNSSLSRHRFADAGLSIS